MERKLRENGKPNENATSLCLNRSEKHRQALLLAVILVGALVVNRLLAHSDDGVGDDRGVFESPLLIWKYPLGDDTPIPTGLDTPGNLLVNGNMDQLGFYWRPPNHWIAGEWFEWFSTKPFNFPEFNDGFERGFYHTYPSSQRLQLWGNDYAGGLLKPARVTPCTHYKLLAYGQSRPGNIDQPPVGVDSHMKVGIEPKGWMSDRSFPNYDPGLEPEDFPDTVIWSPEATHDFVFGPYQVTAEATSDTITVILYSYPEVDLENGVYWNDTIWDTASVVEVPPPSGLILSDDPPDLDGLITNLQVTYLARAAIVEWDTVVPASTQVIYQFLMPSTPISDTASLTHSLYIPMVTKTLDPTRLPYHSSPDTKPVSHHRVVLGGLPATYIIDLVALSRRLEGESCVTSASNVIHGEFLEESSGIFMPVLSRGW